MTGEYVEDPEITPQNRWRWAAPLVLLVVLPLAGIFALRETDGVAFWPGQNSIMRGVASQTREYGAVGTAGSADYASTDVSPGVVREIEALIAGNDGDALVGRSVNLQVPVGARANDTAFWVGSADRRLLVVPNRDRRSELQRQEGLIADNAIAPLETGRMVTITGTVRRLPEAEGMYSWALSAQDRRDAAARGVYLSADRITVQ